MNGVALPCVYLSDCNKKASYFFEKKCIWGKIIRLIFYTRDRIVEFVVFLY